MKWPVLKNYLEHFNLSIIFITQYVECRISFEIVLGHIKVISTIKYLFINKLIFRKKKIKKAVSQNEFVLH